MRFGCAGRSRKGSAATMLLCAALECGQACSTPGLTDAGADANSPDGGVQDAGGVDSGPERPVFASCEGVLVAIPDKPPECGCEPRQDCLRGSCTWECVACSSLSPCPAGWSCDFISPPFCEGVCRKSLDPCPVTPAQFLEVDLVEWGCREDLTGRCVFRHELSRSDGTLRCLVFPPEQVDGGLLLAVLDAGSVDWDGLSTARCLTTSELTSEACFTVQAEVHVRFDDDAGFEYGSSTAFKVPPAFELPVEDSFSACAPSFRGWDGGIYRYRY